MTSHPADVPAVPVGALPAHALLLDVRQQEEWDAGHAPDAVHIPLGELPSRLDELPAEQEVAVVCRSGGRSARATAFLLSEGRKAVNVEGGMQAWASEGRALTTALNVPPSVV